MATSTPHFFLNIVRGPRAQGMCKANGDKFIVVTRSRVTIVPNGKTTRVVARGTIHFCVIRMLFRTSANRGVVAIRASRWRAVRAMTLGAFPALVRRRLALLLNHLKTVLTFMAFDTQLSYAGNRLVFSQSLIPERDRGIVRISDGLMTYLATNMFPVTQFHWHATF